MRQMTKSGYVIGKHGRAVLSVFVAMTVGCGWKSTMEFSSPSKRYLVEILQPRIDNSMAMRVDLVSKNRHLTLYRSPNDAVLNFVHVYWASDEGVVAILAQGTGSWQFAYRTDTGAEVPFESVRNDVSNSITNLYGLESQIDAIRWTMTSEASTRFFGRHPEIHVSYH